MTMTGGGLCADTVISCQNLTLCSNDNRTCSTPNTVCVSNTRCGKPVCFPMDRATPQRCPPYNGSVSGVTTRKFMEIFCLLAVEKLRNIYSPFKYIINNICDSNNYDDNDNQTPG